MKNILTKLNAVMAEVDYIQKDKRNTHQGYTYASEKAIKDALHKFLVKHKVVFYVETNNIRVDNNTTILDVTYHFVDADSGEEVKGVFVGTGQARDDKGNWGAVTGAIKYILTSTFLIPTGDDPENSENESGKPKIALKSSPPLSQSKLTCKKCGAVANEKSGTTKGGKAYHGIFCSTGDKGHTEWLFDNVPMTVEKPLESSPIASRVIVARYSNGLCTGCHAPEERPHARTCEFLREAA